MPRPNLNDVRLIFTEFYRAEGFNEDDVACLVIIRLAEMADLGTGNVVGTDDYYRDPYFNKQIPPGNYPSGSDRTLALIKRVREVETNYFHQLGFKESDIHILIKVNFLLLIGPASKESFDLYLRGTGQREPDRNTNTLYALELVAKIKKADLSYYKTIGFTDIEAAFLADISLGLTRFHLAPKKELFDKYILVDNKGEKEKQVLQALALVTKVAPFVKQLIADGKSRTEHSRIIAAAATGTAAAGTPAAAAGITATAAPEKPPTLSSFSEHDAASSGPSGASYLASSSRKEENPSLFGLPSATYYSSAATVHAAVAKASDYGASERAYDTKVRAEDLGKRNLKETFAQFDEITRSRLSTVDKPPADSTLLGTEALVDRLECIQPLIDRMPPEEILEMFQEGERELITTLLPTLHLKQSISEQIRQYRAAIQTLNADLEKLQLALAVQLSLYESQTSGTGYNSGSVLYSYNGKKHGVDSKNNTKDPMNTATKTLPAASKASPAGATTATVTLMPPAGDRNSK